MNTPALLLFCKEASKGGANKYNVKKTYLLRSAIWIESGKDGYNGKQDSKPTNGSQKRSLNRLHQGEPRRQTEESGLRNKNHDKTHQGAPLRGPEKREQINEYTRQEYYL